MHCRVRTHHDEHSGLTAGLKMRFPAHVSAVLHVGPTLKPWAARNHSDLGGQFVGDSWSLNQHARTASAAAA